MVLSLNYAKFTPLDNFISNGASAKPRRKNNCSTL